MAEDYRGRRTDTHEPVAFYHLKQRIIDHTLTVGSFSPYLGRVGATLYSPR